MAEADKDKPPALVAVEVGTTSKVYTWPGEHPHAPGTQLLMPADHADELTEAGHVKPPKADDAPKAAPEPAADAKPAPVAQPPAP